MVDMFLHRVLCVRAASLESEFTLLYFSTATCGEFIISLRNQLHNSNLHWRFRFRHRGHLTSGPGTVSIPRTQLKTNMLNK